MVDSEKLEKTCVHQWNENCHRDVEPVVKELLELFWDKTGTFKQYLHCIDRHRKYFTTNGKPQVATAVKILGLNLLCCHFGDKLKKEINKTEDDRIDSDTEPNMYKSFLEILKCFSYIKKNKLGSVEQLLRALGQDTICDGVPCEFTAFHWRTKGTYYLHNAWAVTDNPQRKEDFKSSAKECFHKCFNCFKQLSTVNPWCQYLLVLYVQSVATIVCLHLKMCWFLFDPLSILKRFDLHKPTWEGIKKAQECLNSVNSVIGKVEKGSIWERHLNYLLLVMKFFCSCRVTQYNCLCRLHPNPSASIVTLSKALQENYDNETNSDILKHLTSLALRWHGRYEDIQTPLIALNNQRSIVSQGTSNDVESSETQTGSDLDFTDSPSEDCGPMSDVMN